MPVMAADVKKMHSSTLVEVPPGATRDEERRLVDATLDDLVAKIRATQPGPEHPAGSRYLVKNLRETLRRSDGGVLVTVTAELELRTR